MFIMKSCLDEIWWQISITMLDEVDEWTYAEFEAKFSELLAYKARVDKVYAELKDDSDLEYSDTEEQDIYQHLIQFYCGSEGEK